VFRNFFKLITYQKDRLECKGVQKWQEVFLSLQGNILALVRMPQEQAVFICLFVPAVTLPAVSASAPLITKKTVLELRGGY
jgi:hypothetical protein